MGLLGRASPAARLLGAIWMTVALATAPLGSPVALAAALLALVATWMLVKPRRRAVGSILLPALALVVMVCVPVLWSDPARGAWLVARAGSAAAAASFFAARLDELELSAALRTLRVPRGFAAVLSTMLRQAGALRLEARRLVLARELRGARGIHVGPEVLAQLLVRAAARAERVELAMELRGYTPEAAARVPLSRSDAAPVALAGLLGLAPHLATVLHS